MMLRYNLKHLTFRVFALISPKFRNDESQHRRASAPFCIIRQCTSAVWCQTSKRHIVEAKQENEDIVARHLRESGMRTAAHIILFCFVFLVLLPELTSSEFSFGDSAAQ